MKTIASFDVDHDLLDPGLYISRIDGDVITYDLRFKKPNNGKYFTSPSLHSLEHLLAVFYRNHTRGDEILYVGGMGCLTGFYVLTRDTISHRDFIEMTKDVIFDAVRHLEKGYGIPGNTRKQCGNYRMHNGVKALKELYNYFNVVKTWSVSKLNYTKEDI